MKMKVVKVYRGEKKRLKVILEPEVEKRKRKCLVCGKVFVSRGPWNRLCRACRKKVAEVASSGFVIPAHVGRA